MGSEMCGYRIFAGFMLEMYDDSKGIHKKNVNFYTLEALKRKKCQKLIVIVIGHMLLVKILKSFKNSTCICYTSTDQTRWTTKRIFDFTDRTLNKTMFQ